MTGTTWNPSDELHVTLSGSNLIATGNSSSNGGVRGTNSHVQNAGKVTLSFTGVNLSGDGLDYVGVADSAATLGLANGSQANQIIVINSGTTFCPGGVGEGGGFSTITGGGHTVDFAFDFGNGLFWVRADGGAWSKHNGVGTGDPVAGTSGRPIGTITNVLFPYIRVTNTGSTVTIAPSTSLGLTGYVPWDNATNNWLSVEAPDVFAAVGYPGTFGEVGNLLIQEPKDGFAAVGYPAAVGTMAITENPDTFSSFIKLPINATWATTEAKDRFSAAGIGLGEDGVFITTEAPDQFAFLVHTPISAQWHTTENPDQFRAVTPGVTISRTKRREFFVT